MSAPEPERGHPIPALAREEDAGAGLGPTLHSGCTPQSSQLSFQTHGRLPAAHRCCPLAPAVTYRPGHVAGLPAFAPESLSRHHTAGSVTL